MSKYFIFVDAGDDAACYPVDRLVSMTCTSNATLELSFERGLKGLGGEHDVVTLTITADKEKDVMKSISQAAAGRGNYILIADDVTSDYIDSKITACAITYVTGGIEQVKHFGLSGLDSGLTNYFSWCSTNSNQTDIFNHRGIQPRAGKIIGATLTTDGAISGGGTGCAITFTGSSTTGATTHTDGAVGGKVWTGAATGPITSLIDYTWAANDVIIATVVPTTGTAVRAVASLIIQWSN